MPKKEKNVGTGGIYMKKKFKKVAISETYMNQLVHCESQSLKFLVVFKSNWKNKKKKYRKNDIFTRNQFLTNLILDFH